jgi:hypothetical protein
MQFRPVGVERLDEEVAPEGAEFGEGFCGRASAGGPDGEGSRCDRCHDAASVFRSRLFRAKRRFSALKTSFRPIY